MGGPGEEKRGISKFAGKPGTVGAMTVNFRKGDTLFSASDVPDKAREAKEEIMRKKKPDVLGLERPAWNDSIVPTDFKVCSRPMQRQLSRFQTLPNKDVNYRAEVVQKRGVVCVPSGSKFAVPDPVPAHLGDTRAQREFRQQGTMTNTVPLTEPPNHPTLVEKPGWNFETFVPSDQFSDKRVEQLTVVHTAKTKKATERLLKGKAYVPPHKAVAQKMKAEREAKLAERTAALDTAVADASAPLTLSAMRRQAAAEAEEQARRDAEAAALRAARADDEDEDEDEDEM